MHAFVFFPRSRQHIKEYTPKRNLYSGFCLFRLQYYGCIYHLQYAICSRQNPTNDRTPERKAKNDDHNNIPFKAWETPGRMCISCSNFHHTHTALSIALSDPYYKKYLAYEVQTQTSHQRPFFTLNYGPIAYTYVFFCNLYY